MGSEMCIRDSDGDPDLALSNSGGALELLRNDSAPQGWLGIHLVGQRPSIGASVTLRLGDATWRRVVVAGDSYQSSSEARLSFALPPSLNRELVVEVTWPDGHVLRLRNPPRDGYLMVR